MPAVARAYVGPKTSERPFAFSFWGSGGTLFGIHITNLIQTVLTLGVYYFWGRVKVREFLAGQMEFEGDRFAYHGTGKELLFGFLRAAAIVGCMFVLLVALSNATAPGATPEWLEGVFGVEILLVWGMLALAVGLTPSMAVIYLISLLEQVPGNLPPIVLQGTLSATLLIMAPMALVGARRYQWSRTSWRGIRFSFRGTGRAFAAVLLGGALATLLTLGMFYPLFQTKKHAFLARHSYFGNHHLEFDGRARDLLGPFLLAVLLTIPTLGLCWWWFSAKMQRFLWEHTVFDAARFQCTISGLGLFGLHFVNGLILSFTLGIGGAWVTVRNLDFLTQNVWLEGELDLDSIQQEARNASATGEGLEGLLGEGTDFGLF